MAVEIYSGSGVMNNHESIHVPEEFRQAGAGRSTTGGADDVRWSAPAHLDHGIQSAAEFLTVPLSVAASATSGVFAGLAAGLGMFRLTSRLTAPDAHALSLKFLPEASTLIRDRCDSPDDLLGLRELEFDHPGLLDATDRVIRQLEAYEGIVSTRIECDPVDGSFPVSIWAESSLPLEGRGAYLRSIHELTEETLGRFSETVLVAVM